MMTVGIIRKTIMLSLVTLCLNQALCQSGTGKRDSLQKVADKGLLNPSELDVYAYMDFLEVLQKENEYDQMARYARKLFLVEDAVEEKIELGRAYSYLSLSLQARGVVDSLIYEGIQSILYLENLENMGFNKYELINERLMAFGRTVMAFGRKNNSDKVEQYLMEAVALIEGVDLDVARREYPYFRTGNFYALLGEFYDRAERFEEAQNAYYQYKKEALAMNDTSMLAVAQFQYTMSMSRRLEVHPSLLIDELNKIDLDAFNLSKLGKEIVLNAYAKFYVRLGKDYLVKSSYDSAKGLYDSAEDLKSSVKDFYDSAKSFADKATIEVLLTNNRPRIANQYWANVTTARKQKDWLWAYANYEILSAYDMQALRSTSERAIGELEGRLESERIQTSLNLELKAENTNKTLIAVGAIALLIINVVLFRYFSVAKRAKALNEVENEKLTIANELAAEKKERLESILDYKRRQLATTVISTNRMNSNLEDIADKLKEVKDNSEDAPRLIDRLLREIATSVKSQDDWAQFYKHFEGVHPDFFGKLLRVNSELNNNDLRHAAYMLMNLSNKEVASMHNISPDSCKTARKRLKKRLNLLPEDSLQTFINNLVAGSERILRQA